MSDRGTSHEPSVTQGHSSDGRLVISPEPVVTKGHNSQVVKLVPPHLQKVELTNISTCLRQYLRAVTTDTREINFLYPLSPSFFKSLVNS
jgi:hypothetical protein